MRFSIAVGLDLIALVVLPARLDTWVYVALYAILGATAAAVARRLRRDRRQ